MRTLFAISVFVLSFDPSFAHAGDGATIAFRSGQIAYIDNGYQKIIDAMLELNRKSQDHKIVQLSVGGSTFLLNVAEVVLVCRDRCRTVDFQDPRKTKKE